MRRQRVALLIPAVLILAGCSSAPKMVTPSRTTLPSGVNATGYAIDGVSLVPISREERRQCQVAANQTRSAMPCPDLIPAPDPASLTEAACDPVSDQCAKPMVNVGSILWDQYAFKVPPGYVGVEVDAYNGRVPALTVSGEPLGHLVIMAGKNLDTSLYRSSTPHPIPGYCAPVVENPPIVIHGSPASMFECGQDPSVATARYIETVSGHELLEWEQDDVTCEVSFHGHSEVNQNLDVAVARATSMTFPQNA